MKGMQWLVLISETTNLVSILLCLFFFKRLKLPTKIILVHLCLLFLANSSSAILAKFKINNYFLLHLLTIIDLLLIGYFYHTIINTSKKKLFYLKILVAIGFIFCLLESFVFSTLKEANIYSIVLVASIKITLIASYFYTNTLGIIKEKIEIYTKEQLSFWNIFSASLLIYTSSTLIFFLFLNVLVELNLQRPFIYTNLSLYLFSTLLVLYAIIRYIRKTSPQ